MLRRQRRSQRFLTGLVGGVGLPCGLLGGAGVISGLAAGEEVGGALLLLGVGIVLTAGLFALNTFTDAADRITFDNAAGAVRIEDHVEPGATTATMSYARIRSFHCLQYRAEDSRDWVVEMLRHDGASWALFRALRRSKAEAFLAELRDAVDLKRAAERVVPELSSTAAFEVDHDASRTRITWRGRYTRRRLLGGFGVLAGFAVALIGAPGMPTIGRLLIAVLAPVVALAFALLAVRQRRGFDGVEISRQRLLSFSGSGDWRLTNFEVPLAEVASVICFVGPAELQDHLYVVSEADSHRLAPGEPDPAGLTALLAVARGRLGARHLSVFQRTVAEKLQLDQLIHAALAHWRE